MKITDVKTYLTMPVERRAWLFVEVETDEGVTGLGECTDYFVNPHLVRGIELVHEQVERYRVDMDDPRALPGDYLDAKK